MSSTTTIAFVEAWGSTILCPTCHDALEKTDEGHAPGQWERLCQRDLDADEVCDECSEALAPEPPNEWDDGGGKERYYAAKYGDAL